MATRRLLDCLILFGFVVCCGECFYTGCPPCEFVQCPELSCDESHQVLDQECGCCSVCVKLDGERCGGLTNDQCKPGSTCMYRLGMIIGENRTGICEPVACKRMHCDFRRYCTWARAEDTDPWKLVCKCPWFDCREKYHPLCGYDGVTYKSNCDLQATECIDAHQYIGRRHYGPCAPQPEAPTHKSHYIQTNTIPMYDDDLFNQLGPATNDVTPPTPPGCVYKEKTYLRNSTIQIDPCTLVRCDLYFNLTIVIIPGCPSGPIEPDYGLSVAPIHGGWTEWEVTECTGTCHGANWTRTRNCTNPKPHFEGRNCSGPPVEVFKCIPEHCNYTCEYGEWSDWSPCSVTCGNGTRTRTRGLLNNITKEESNNCDLEETEKCTALEKTCPTYCQVVITGLKTYYRDDGCPTTRERPILECVGPCAGGGSECCQVKKRKRYYWAVHCPGEDFWQEGRFKQPKECHCTSEDCPATPPL